LTIAGSDSSGGAGIQADIKAISATGGYAASVITALTAQNTVGVDGIFAVPAEFVSLQLDSVFSDINFLAIKIGMLYSPQIIFAVAERLKKWHAKNVVLDPVMVAKSGHKLITDEALTALKEKIFPLAYLITPNLKEAEVLLHSSITTHEQMEKAAQELAEIYHTNILVKGGHLTSAHADDVLFCYASKKIHWFSRSRIISKNTHGTGCTFSAAIASYLAQGNDLFNAITKAKDYLTTALTMGSRYTLGKGHGPIGHFL
jgi:hydroxymethylpyrimidine/phosphomethylpyrimidine kinase